jgi:hypothetical protein
VGEKRRLLQSTLDFGLACHFKESFHRLFNFANAYRGRRSPWIEPALIAEWARLMKGYAEAQERKLSDAVLAWPLMWAEPKCEVNLAKRIAMDLLQTENLFCIRTKGRLTFMPGKKLKERLWPWAIYYLRYAIHVVVVLS